MKKWILWIVACLSLFGLSFAQVSVNPIYTSERFKPSDKFHAGCENQIDVVFQLNKSKINWINAILHYDWDRVEILKVIANWEKENNLTYTVEKDKIIFSKLKSDWNWLDDVTFSVFFKVSENVELAQFSFEKWSYIVDSKWNMVDLEWNYSFEFVEVPECDPDIVAPSVELLFPSDKTWEYVALDTYFQFEIYDSWKWINEDSIKIRIGNSAYTLVDIEHIRKNNVLTIYPDIWMPFNTGFEVQISVSDKQSYGKPNSTVKLYEFQTSNELKLLNEINPVEFRRIVNKSEYLKWTKEECGLLSEIYSDWNKKNEGILESINDKLECEELVFIEKTWDIIAEANKSWKEFSVFAMIWWMLFWSLFFSVVFGWLGKK